MPFPGFDINDYNTPEFTRYADAHKELKGPGDARPTALQIINDNNLQGIQLPTYTTILSCPY